MDVAFFDIDNTLTWRDPKTGWGNEATPASKDAIRRFSELGNVALLSTGRAPQGVPQCLQDLPFRGMLCFDGALALLDGKRVSAHFIPAQDLEEALAEAHRAHMGILFSGPEGRAFAGERRGFEWHATQVESLEELKRVLPSLEVGKLAFRYFDLPHYKESSFFQTQFACYQSAPDYFELVCPGVGKDVAAHELVRALEEGGGTVGRTLAFGDSENDIPLLRAADIAVAMGNASHAAKEAASYVTDDVHHEGVAHALAHLGYI